MPGPLPKDPAVRQRRNKSSTRAILPAESLRLRAPSLPELENGEVWHPMAMRFWRQIWSSPMSSEFLRADEPALLRLVLLVHLFWSTQKLSVAKEIRMIEREFGLTPLSRRRLEWTVAAAEEAKDQHEHKRMKRAASVVEAEFHDPRGVLDE